LSRTITFVYSNNNLQKITQLWNGTDHPWAQFEYSSLTIQTSFSGLSIVAGPQNGTTLTVLSKVTLDDGSYFTFDYASYGQVKQINHYAADGHLLAYTAYDMNTATGQTDCPRFTTRTDYAENWNTVNTSFTFDEGAGAGSVTTPDLTLTKETHSVSGYNKGLTTRVDTYSSGQHAEENNCNHMDTGQHRRLVSAEPSRYRDRHYRRCEQSKTDDDQLFRSDSAQRHDLQFPE
jgi:hypothetical protein